MLGTNSRSIEAEAIPLSAAPVRTQFDLMSAEYVAARELVSRLGGGEDSEPLSDAAWQIMEGVMGRLATLSSTTMADVELKLRIVLDMMDEQDPARFMMISAVADLRALAEERQAGPRRD